MFGLSLTQIAVIAILILNLITFITYGIDKHRARRGAWRVSEFTLLTLALIGGSIGAYAAMQLFRHKTQHAKFSIGVPLIMIAQAIAIYYFWQ